MIPRKLNVLQDFFFVYYIIVQSELFPDENVNNLIILCKEIMLMGTLKGILSGSVPCLLQMVLFNGQTNNFTEKVELILGQLSLLCLQGTNKGIIR